MTVRTERRQLTVGGERLLVAYDVAGEGSTVVFLHGITSSRRIFVPTLEAARPGERRLAVDFPGFGDSSLPRRRQELEDYLSFLDAFLPTQGRAVDLVGHSFGGMVAALYALAAPERVRRLVLVDAAGFMAPLHALKPLPSYALNWLLIRFLVWRDGGRSLLRGVGLDPDALDPRFRTLLAHGVYRLREALRMGSFYETEPLGPRLRAAGRVAAYIWGERDPLFPFAAVRPHLGPGPVWVLPGEGHAPMVGDPAGFEAALRAALPWPPRTDGT
jgi:pimeloyl-ACP methyl ester carboxylesterase